MAKGQKIGALWVREQRGGGTFMTGEITVGGVKQKIVIFTNSYRTEANRQPNLIIYEETQPSSAERSPESSPEPSAGPENWFPR